MKRDDQLNAILDSMLPIKLSFGTFILECLKSKDKRIINKMRYFYANSGPAKLIDIWAVQVHKEDDARSILKSATDLLVKNCVKELNDASEDPKLRLRKVSHLCRCHRFQAQDRETIF